MGSTFAFRNTCVAVIGFVLLVCLNVGVESAPCSQYTLCDDCLGPVSIYSVSNRCDRDRELGAAQAVTSCAWCQASEIGSCVNSTEIDTLCPGKVNQYDSICPNIVNASASQLSGVSASFSALQAQIGNLTTYTIWGNPKTFGLDIVHVTYSLYSSPFCSSDVVGKEVLDNRNGQYVIRFTPLLYGTLEISISINGVQSTKKNVTVVPNSVPVVSSATFSTEFSFIEIEFDSETNMGDIDANTRFNCSTLLNTSLDGSFSHTQVFGEDSYCTWKGSSTLVVTLGASAQIRSGDTLGILSNNVYALHRTSISSCTDIVAVQYPDTRLVKQPLAIVSGPSQVPASYSSDDVTWTALFSDNVLGIGTFFDWDVLSCNDTIPGAMIAYFASDESNSSSISFSPVDIFPVAPSYCTFRLSVYNLFSNVSSTSFNVSLILDSPPVISVVDGVDQMIYSDVVNVLLLNVAIEPVLSFSESFSVDWEITSPPAMVSTYSSSFLDSSWANPPSSSHLIIPANSFDSVIDSDVQMSATVNVLGGRSVPSSRVEIRLEVIRSPCVVVVEGATASGVSEGLTLDGASKSVDPSNSTAKFLCSWNCLSGACIALPLVNVSSNLQSDINSCVLDIGGGMYSASGVEMEIEVVLNAEVMGLGRDATKSERMFLSLYGGVNDDGFTPIVSISRYSTRNNDPQQPASSVSMSGISLNSVLVLESSVTLPAGSPAPSLATYSYVWTLPDSFPSDSVLSSSLFESSLVLDGGVISPFSEYDFKCEVTRLDDDSPCPGCVGVGWARLEGIWRRSFSSHSICMT